MEEKYQIMLDNPNKIDEETLIAIKNQLTRFFISKNQEYKSLNIQEIDTDDFYYVIDAINLKYGKDAAIKASDEINSYLKSFLKVFTDYENADPELKRYIGELIGKSELSKDDFELTIDLFKKNLYIKKLELLYDQKGKNEGIIKEDRYPAGSHYLHFEQEYGISAEKLKSIIEENPALNGIYNKYLAAFYARKYEKTYLSMLLDSYDDKNQRNFKNLVSRKMDEEIVRKRNSVFNTTDFEKQTRAADITTLRLLLEKNLYTEKSFNIALEKELEEINGKSPWEQHEGKNGLIYRETSANVRMIFDKIIRDIKSGKRNTKISSDMLNIKIDKDPEREAVYDYIEKQVKKIVEKVLVEITKDYKKKKLNEIHRKVEKNFKSKAEKYAQEKLDLQQILLYRVNKNGTDVKATNPESRISPQIHIGDGSSRDFESPYISTSNIFYIMSTYLYSYDQNNPEMAFDSPRASTLIIDMKKLYEIMRSRRDEIEKKDIPLIAEGEFLLELLTEVDGLSEESKNKLEERINQICEIENIELYTDRDKNIPEDILDFSTKSEIEKRNEEQRESKRKLRTTTTTLQGTEKKFSFSKNFAEASAEVLLKTSIPSEVITEIDPLLFDTLLLTDLQERDSLISKIVQKNVNLPNVLEDFFEQEENAEETFGLDEHELYFLTGYYIQKRPINELLSVYKYKKGRDEVLYDQAMRTDVVKKLVANDKFRNLAVSYGIELPQNMVEHEIVPAIGVARHSTSNTKTSLEDKRIEEKAIVKEGTIQVFYKADEKDKFTHATGNISTSSEELQLQVDEEVIRTREGGDKQRNFSFSTESSAKRVRLSQKNITLKLKKPFEDSKYSAIEAAKELLKTSQKYKNASKKESTPKSKKIEEDEQNL